MKSRIPKQTNVQGKLNEHITKRYTDNIRKREKEIARYKEKKVHKDHRSSAL